MSTVSRIVALLLTLALSQSLTAQNLVHVNAPELPELPAVLQNPLPGAIDGDPVVLGGYATPGDSSSWSTSGWLLDNNAWSRVDDLATAVRPDAATVISGNALFVAGGRTDTGWSDAASLLTRTGTTVNVQELTALPIQLEHPAAAVQGGSIVVSGYDPARPNTVVTYSLNAIATLSSWAEMEALPIPSAGRLNLAVQNGGLYALVTPLNGGSSALYRHDESGWSEKAAPPTGIRAFAAFAMGQAHIGVFAPENANGSERQELVAYSTISNEWSDVGHWDVPARESYATVDGKTVLVARVVDGGETMRISRAEFDVGKRPFYLLDYAMVIAYLMAMIIIGFYFSRKENGTDDFFVGGRKMPWWAVGFSLYATGTSAISFMAIPAKSYATDWLYLTQNVVGTLAIIPVAIVIVPLIRRLSLTSTYEYLEMRFHTSIRLMGSILAIVYQLGARMSVVLFLPALALSAVTGVDVVTSIVFMGLIATIYTVLGGIKAVIWTDVVQVVVLLGGALLCLIIIIADTNGGVGQLLSVASADSKMHMFDWRLDLTIPTVWLFLILSTADTITWPRDQVMVQRVLSTKSAKEAGFSVWTLGLIVIPGSVLFFTLGTALYGFYKMNPAKLSPLLDLDATFPFFIASELPAGVAGLIIAALFAASMSTLDSSMNSVSTIVVVDFIKRFKQSLTDKAALRLAKWITVATGVFGTVFALVLSRYSLPSLWDTFIMLTGLLGGGFGGVYTLGMFTRRANWQGALVGIVGSIFVTLAVRAYTDIHVLLYTGVAIISCIVIGYIVSLFFPMQTKSLHGLTVFRVDNPKD